MPSEIQQWVEDVRFIPLNESLPLAPLDGEEDVFHALEQTSGDPHLYLWNGTSFNLVGTGPRPHKPV